MNPISSLHVDGAAQELRRFAVPEMSLSSARAAMQQHEFVLAIQAQSLVSFLQPAYSAWIADSRADDVAAGSPQDELGLAGYPTLSKLLEAPKLLELVIGRYLVQELVGKLCWDGFSPIEYWLDRTTGCHVEGDTVYLSGFCFSRATDEAEPFTAADGFAAR